MDRPDFAVYLAVAAANGPTQDNVMQSNSRRGAYGPARPSDAQLEAEFPLLSRRHAGRDAIDNRPSTDPALQLLAEVDKAELARAKAAFDRDRPDPDVWPYWTMVPCDQLDLDAFSEEGDRLGHVLDRARIRVVELHGQAGKGGAE